jgi:hypothetical protein
MVCLIYIYGGIYSQFQFSDDQQFTERIRMLQRNLITAHISLTCLGEKDVRNFQQDILPPTKLAFTWLRRDIDLAI